jgi:hypothetical protein
MNLRVKIHFSSFQTLFCSDFFSKMNRLLGNKHRASFDVNQRPSTYKVYYLGNVATSLTRGDGCADRPAKILWDMHLKNQGLLGRKLRLTVTNSGLQAESYSKTSSTNDITLYCTNRIAYYLVANQLNPKMFIWVYRHVNIRSGLTTEVRFIHINLFYCFELLI